LSDGFWQAPVDFFSLILILVAGIELGLMGFFGFSSPSGLARPAAHET
jgi:hypothetical protein